ncbi:MAG: hypothetical protein RL186_1118 [Pseudomonadota bacterium]|jgi:hypothetical protein
MLDAVEKMKLPIWFWIVAGLGAAWNVFGIVQFLGAIAPTAESLAAKGMTPSQAAVYMSIPLWMNVSFAIGTFGGLIGSMLLLWRNRGAKPVFAASLAGYIALYIGDITHGVFAALGAPQVIVLTSVVAIAAALLWVAHVSQKRGYLS